jgi:AcrR family transcriptional regulator
VPRADAQRNRERLLDAAQQAFADVGVTAALDDIARAAGVGAGTLYRHFPTRDRLVLALMRTSLDELTARAGTLAAERQPAEALAAWLDGYAAHAARFRGLAATLASTGLDPDDPSAVACVEAHAAGRALVTAAQASGDVSPAVDPQDVLDMALAVAWVLREAPRGEDQRRRLLGVVLAGVTSGP